MKIKLINLNQHLISLSKFSNFSTSSSSAKMSLSWRPENYPFLPKLIHPFLFPSSFHPPIRDGVIPRYQPTYRLQLCIFSFIMACLPSPFPRPKIIDNGRFPLKTRSHFPPRPCSWLSLSPSSPSPRIISVISRLSTTARENRFMSIVCKSFFRAVTGFPVSAVASNYTFSTLFSPSYLVT